MKKLLVCVAALGMLFTSCMRDETRLDEGSVVSFNISAPAVSTRAAIEDTYGTGVAADDLHWAIFEQDENGAAVGDAIFSNVEEGFFADGTLENTFNVRLVKGKSYVGMFWAQANGAPYKVEWPEVSFDGDINSNDEDLDAFFNIHKFSITAGQETGEQKVELRRPFAQLNVAIPATDLDAAKAAGFELAKTGVTLNVAKSLNLVTGKVGATEDVTYNLANIPSDVTATLEGNTYQLISFNYVLVDGDAWTTESDEGQELKNNITFNFAAADGEVLSQTFSNIAVERNHRTYIVGSLLSETVDFRVIILPEWEDPYYLNNMEAGSIEMVAEQTTINKAAMGSATLTWNAVEGAVYYGVEYKGEELGKVNPDGTTRADDATATVTWNTPEGKVTDATASFTIKAYNENGKVIARVVTEPIAVFSLANRPEPAVYVADGKLIVENKELLDLETTKSNLGLNGVLLEAEVYFYKDGATTPAYTAKGSYIDTYPTANLPLSITEKKIKNNLAGSYYTWKWDGATTATTALPAFEKGTYTIKYKAGYYPVINASYRHKEGVTDGIVVTDSSDILAEMQYREGEVKDFKLVIAEATTPEAVAEGYQGAKVTWPAVDGAASYQVFVGATKVADATTNEATVTGLKDANKYKFIVKSLDANGNVIATSVESNEIQVWTLTGMPTPAVSFDGATLSVSDILDVYGVGYDVTITFTNGSLTHTATYNKAFDQDGVKSRFSGNGFMAHANTEKAADLGRFTKSSFDPCTTWYWDKTPASADYQTQKEDATPAFEVGEWTISYSVSYAPLINAYWSEKNSTEVMDKNNAKANRVNLKNKGADVLFDPANPIKLEGTLADKFVVKFEVEAFATVDAVELKWDPVVGATYEIYANGTKVGETKETSYVHNVTAIGDYNYEIKVAGTETSATASAKVEYLFASYWTAPKFSFTGTRMLVTELTNVDAASTCAYAYGGAITNDNDTSKSTIEIYKDGQLMYTLTNGTGQSTLTDWAGYGRWALGAQENRKDWVWTKADGNQLMAGEGDVPAGSLPAGTYTLKWTIGYVVCKNASWDKSGTTVSDRASADRIWFGPKDTKPSPNVAYTSPAKNAVKIMAKTGEATLTVQ